MSRLRIVMLLVLFFAPWVFLVGVGSYHLVICPGPFAYPFNFNWMFWAGWAMFVSIALAYLLAWRWTRRAALPQPDVPPPNYWTERDKQAWEKVKAKAASYDRVTTGQLTDPKHYTDLALDLATQVSAVYTPGVTAATEAFDQLTLPEILACAELAAADLNGLVQQYVPGSHMLRVKDAKRARKATEWYNTGQNAYWAASAILNPVQAIPRYLASRVALGGLFERIQSNVILWFHTAFVQQLGHYLIELNSGRLKVGVKRYRELLAARVEPPQDALAASAVPADANVNVNVNADMASPVAPAAAIPPAVRPVGIAVLGPVKAGKSSLVNALLGQSKARVDTLPVPHIGVEYDLVFPGGQPVRVVDTCGYGQEGPNEAEFGAAVEAAQKADLIVLVTQANNPGRKPDVDLLDQLRDWFAARPHLKMPPVVMAMNQVDLLTPKAEWSPPYNWRTGTGDKETNIRDCVATVKDQIGDRVVAVVPVCARAGETFGIIDGLVPELASHLDDARGSAILKAFDAEASAGQVTRIGHQVLEGGKKMLSILWNSLKK